MFQNILAILRPLRLSSTPFKRIYAIIQHVNTISDFLSAIATVAGFLGTGVAAGAFNLPAIRVEQWPLPLRMVVFLLLACGMGWALGGLMRLLRRLPRDPRLLLSSLAAIAIAGMVAGCADWLVPPQRRSDFPLLPLLMLSGALGATRTAVLSLKGSRGTAATAEIREVSTILLIFALASAALLALAEMGVR